MGTGGIMSVTAGQACGTARAWLHSQALPALPAGIDTGLPKVHSGAVPAYRAGRAEPASGAL
nr:hypothetical protein GCM10017547_25540 [Pseudarthrobacter oxydans]